MPFPRIRDTVSWAKLTTNNEWPRATPSLYVRYYLVMERLGRGTEAAALLSIIKKTIEKLALRQLQDRQLMNGGGDVADTVTNELLHALLRPRSSGRRGLRKFFFTTVRRKADSVAKREIYRQHKFLQLDATSHLQQPDPRAMADVEANLIAEQARSLLKGAKRDGFDDAIRSASDSQSGLSAAERYAVARREMAARNALREIFELAEQREIRSQPLSKRKVKRNPLPVLKPETPAWKRRIAEFSLLESVGDELPADWEKQIDLMLEGRARTARLEHFHHLLPLYQTTMDRPDPVDFEKFDHFDDFDKFHSHRGFDIFDDFYELADETDDFDDLDELINAA